MRLIVNSPGFKGKFSLPPLMISNQHISTPHGNSTSPALSLNRGVMGEFVLIGDAIGRKILLRSDHIELGLNYAKPHRSSR
jgi:hypothetical protein